MTGFVSGLPTKIVCCELAGGFAARCTWASNSRSSCPLSSSAANRSIFGASAPTTTSIRGPAADAADATTCQMVIKLMMSIRIAYFASSEMQYSFSRVRM